MTEDRNMGAAVAAVSLGIGDSLYQDLAPGQYFRFSGSSTVYRKLAGGSYKLAGERAGRAFRTGQLTAVFRVAEPPPC